MELRNVPAQILIVDDEPRIANSLALLMQLEGCFTRCATNAEDAMGVWTSGYRPDIVLTDYLLNGISGLTLISWLRTNGCQAKFVLMSGLCKSIAPNGMGIQFLQKPFSASELFATTLQSDPRARS